MNVLLVVPFHADLPLLASEAETLVNLLQPRLVLQGDVTEERLRAAIEDAVRADGLFMGVWFATHSSERELQLSDGAIGRDALVQYLAQTGANWVVLNSCESEGLAAGIAAIGIDVLAVAMTDGSKGIEDKDALRAAHFLASALRDSDGDLQAAYDSIPHIGNQHRLFPASVASRGYNNNDPNLARLIYELRGTVTALESKLDAMDRKIDGLTNAMENRPTASQVVGMVLFGCLSVLMFIGLIAYLFQRGVL